ncbi:hypothetical protein DHD80_04695 [Gramella sp. AN32]|nr:hypothetical protein [Gramella sp. AN32]
MVNHLSTKLKNPPKTRDFLIKNFLKPTLPQARRRVIAPVLFWPLVKKPKFYIPLTRNCEKAVPTSPRGEVKSGNPDAKASGNYLD